MSCARARRREESDGISGLGVFQISVRHCSREGRSKLSDRTSLVKGSVSAFQRSSGRDKAVRPRIVPTRRVYASSVPRLFKFDRGLMACENSGVTQLHASDECRPGTRRVSSKTLASILVSHSRQVQLKFASFAGATTSPRRYTSFFGISFVETGGFGENERVRRFPIARRRKAVSRRWRLVSLSNAAVRNRWAA